MKQDISFSQLFKDTSLLHEFRYRLGNILLFLQMGKAFHPVHFHQEGEIQRAVDTVNILFLNGKLILDHAQQALIHTGFHFQPDRLAPLPLFQLLFNFLQQILRFVLIDGQIRIPHDTEGMGAYHVIIQKQSGNIPFYDLLQKDDGLFTGFFRRDRHNT